MISVFSCYIFNHISMDEREDWGEFNAIDWLLNDPICFKSRGKQLTLWKQLMFRQEHAWSLSWGSVITPRGVRDSLRLLSVYLPPIRPFYFLIVSDLDEKYKNGLLVPSFIFRIKSFLIMHIGTSFFRSSETQHHYRACICISWPKLGGVSTDTLRLGEVRTNPIV